MTIAAARGLRMSMPGLTQSPLVRSFLALIVLSPGMAMASAQSQKSPWTAQDYDKAVSSAAATASTLSDRNAQAAALVDLADVLAKAGATDRARGFAQAAAKVVGSDDSSTSFLTRERVAASLGQFAATQSLEALVGAVASADEKAALLDKFGVARARAGDISAARQVLSELPPLLSGGSQENLRVSAADMDIGEALAEAGAPRDAAILADSLPAGAAKFVILEDAAFNFCRTGGNSDTAAGHDTTEQLVQAATTIPTPDSASGMGILLQRGRVMMAGSAIAICEGPEIALRFVHSSLPEPQATYARAGMADWFVTNKAMDLARAVAPAPDPTNADSLLDAANRFIREGDTASAKHAALEASRVALEATQNSMPRSQWYDHLALLGRIFGALAGVGEYEQAIATIQPNDPVNRIQYYIFAEQDAASARDAAAVARLLPGAIDAARGPQPGDGSIYQLHRLTLALVTAGYLEAARTTFNKAYAVYNDLPKHAQPVFSDRDAIMIAEMQAWLGDVQGALATANRAGPLTAERSAMAGLLPALMAELMGYDNAPSPPSQAQIKAETERLAQRLEKVPPTTVPAGKALALGAVAVALADQGNIAGALRTEAGLETEPRDILQGMRDEALASIAIAEAKSSDLQSSFDTALRVAEPKTRLKALLALVAIPPPLTSRVSPR